MPNSQGALPVLRVGMTPFCVRAKHVCRSWFRDAYTASVVRPLCSHHGAAAYSAKQVT